MQPKYKFLLIACSLLIFSRSLKAQFENKVTFNFSLGGIQPVGVKEYIYQSNNLHYENTFIMPYLFSNYKKGFTFTGGAQFNINRFFSVGTGIGIERIGNWEYTEAYTWNDERKEKAEKMGLKPVDVTILASIVQSETSKTEELKTISGL